MLIYFFEITFILKMFNFIQNKIKQNKISIHFDLLFCINDVYGIKFFFGKWTDTQVHPILMINGGHTGSPGQPRGIAPTKMPSCLNRRL
jgi:hypothetical protein